MHCRGIWFDALELGGVTNLDDLEKSNSKSRLRIKRQNAAWRESPRETFWRLRLKSSLFFKVTFSVFKKHNLRG